MSNEQLEVAKLNADQLKEIMELEAKLNVTLVAYENTSI